MTVRILHGDCIEQLRLLPDESVHSVVTDPPYGLEFMGKEWDSPRLWGRDDSLPRTGPNRNGNWNGDAKRPRYEAGQAFQAFCEAWARECLRVLKPGGHLLSFGGSRTYHRMACAIEDAGFEIRDQIMWIYASGFPKSLDVSKAIDKAAGHWRGMAGEVTRAGHSFGTEYERSDKGEPITAAAAAWQGWGTALKPAHEPIVVARKPLIGTVAANVLKHGTGAINVDACRIGTDDDLNGGTYSGERRLRDVYTSTDSDRNAVPLSRLANGAGEFVQPLGRWPANLILSYPEDEYEVRNNLSAEQKRELYGWLGANA